MVSGFFAWFDQLKYSVSISVDHYIYFFAAYLNQMDLIKKCDITKQDFWKNYFISERPVILTVFPFHKFEIPFLEVIPMTKFSFSSYHKMYFQFYDVAKAIYWCYSEILIISMSLTVATRFNQLTNRVESLRGRVLSLLFWNELYSHYMMLYNLVLLADKILSPLIVAYSFSNIFFICEKVFRLFE